MTKKIRTTEIIKYDNQFNAIRTFNLMEAKAQDLFFSIIAAIQKIDPNMINPGEKKYILSCKDVCHLGSIVTEKNNFNPQQLKTLISDINIHVPYLMHISLPKISITDLDREHLEVCVTEKLQKLFWNISDDVEVTQFKLSSFVAMQSKYTKAIYRLLSATSNGSDHGIYCASIVNIAKRLGTENLDYIARHIPNLLRDIASTGDLQEAAFGNLHFDNLYYEHNPPTNPDQIVINYVWSPDRLK